MGVTTALVNHLHGSAIDRETHAVFVQADDRAHDATFALHSRLGTREDVPHFGIAPR